jgi:cytochrome c oxidase subunit 2
MFYYGWIGYKLIENVPRNAMQINVTGRMWSWLFEYDNGAQSDTLYVPLDQPIKLNLRSQDVIHSFFIPAFRVKHDVVPGNEKGYIWFQPKDLGKYDVLCTEYCGQQHAYMKTKVVVLPAEEFQTWQTTKTNPEVVPDSSAKKKTVQNTTSVTKAEQDKSKQKKEIPPGLKLLNDNGCTACHSTDGTTMVGPSYKDIVGKKQAVITNGKERQVIFDEAYFKRSVLKPDADIVKGYDPIMPEPDKTFTDEELKEMFAYIKSLK